MNYLNKKGFPIVMGCSDEYNEERINSEILIPASEDEGEDEEEEDVLNSSLPSVCTD